eukprot:144393-Chlamydomonas_euryale.AAC.2
MPFSIHACYPFLFASAAWRPCGAGATATAALYAGLTRRPHCPPPQRPSPRLASAAWRLCGAGATATATLYPGPTRCPTVLLLTVPPPPPDLQVQHGDRVVLVLPPGLEFLDAFLGCLVAGVVAVPVYPPNPATIQKDLQRLSKIVDIAGVKLAITTSEFRAKVRQQAGSVALYMGCLWRSGEGGGEVQPDRTLFSPRNGRGHVLWTATSSAATVTLPWTDLICCCSSTG